MQIEITGQKVNNEYSLHPLKRKKEDKIISMDTPYKKVEAILARIASSPITLFTYLKQYN
ncbi:MAG: hypothetical protein H6Q14_2252 [Bacteroidetes bacterium]|nr:hypothetical protein [Bacteroidota bacterium]